MMQFNRSPEFMLAVIFFLFKVWDWIKIYVNFTNKDDNSHQIGSQFRASSRNSEDCDTDDNDSSTPRDHCDAGHFLGNQSLARHFLLNQSLADHYLGNQSLAGHFLLSQSLVGDTPRKLEIYGPKYSAFHSAVPACLLTRSTAPPEV